MSIPSLVLTQPPIRWIIGGSLPEANQTIHLQPALTLQKKLYLCYPMSSQTVEGQLLPPFAHEHHCQHVLTLVEWVCQNICGQSVKECKSTWIIRFCRKSIQSLAVIPQHVLNNFLTHNRIQEMEIINIPSAFMPLRSYVRLLPFSLWNVSRINCVKHDAQTSDAVPTRFRSSTDRYLSPLSPYSHAVHLIITFSCWVQMMDLDISTHPVNIHETLFRTAIVSACAQPKTKDTGSTKVHL
jgi:hypothetical protein